MPEPFDQVGDLIDEAALRLACCDARGITRDDIEDSKWDAWRLRAATVLLCAAGWLRGDQAEDARAAADPFVAPEDVLAHELERDLITLVLGPARLRAEVPAPRANPDRDREETR